jgi:hypothetical protein
MGQISIARLNPTERIILNVVREAGSVKLNELESFRLRSRPRKDPSIARCERRACRIYAQLQALLT